MRRAGAALLAVMLALGLVGALVVGGAYVTRVLARASAIRERGAALDPCAELGVLRAVTTWDSVARRAQQVGTVQDVEMRMLGHVQAHTSVTRTSPSAWWVVSDCSDSAKPLLRRRLGYLVLELSGRAIPAPRRAWADLP